MRTVWHVDKCKITFKLVINSRRISRGPAVEKHCLRRRTSWPEFMLLLNEILSKILISFDMLLFSVNLLVGHTVHQLHATPVIAVHICPAYCVIIWQSVYCLQFVTDLQ